MATRPQDVSPNERKSKMGTIYDTSEEKIRLGDDSKSYKTNDIGDSVRDSISVGGRFGDENTLTKGSKRENKDEDELQIMREGSLLTATGN